ncbi:spermine synthase isoform X2 [Bradysia coprophila]|uniref:spermine synthase isoform X2 n=1 Tax=Bradysia coprophila TaxID=38358 RepID=UPI00187D81B6|nr:spermine synthase isoform X2 [Bradysia coprophila]
MSVQTVLLDFSIDPVRIGDEVASKDLLKFIKQGLKKYFENLKFVYDLKTDDGYLCLFTDKNLVFIQIRFFNHGIITINIEYFKSDTGNQIMSFESKRELCDYLEAKLEVNGYPYPNIKRDGLNKYFYSSDERILEYDIDKVLFDKRSPFQKVQIVHSKSLGNMLVLDELQNISEADLIYTETLMQRGIQNYEGKEICILGGGDGALLYELLKENPKFVTMLEIDEMVMQACNVHLQSICGDVLERRQAENFEIIVGDCMVALDKYVKEGKKFDFVFGDLTDIPISETPTGEIWNFIRTILQQSFKILKPNGKYLTHGNGTNCPESLRMYEEQLKQLEPKVKFTTTKAFVPSFMEEWVFYQVSVDV